MPLSALIFIVFSLKQCYLRNCSFAPGTVNNDFNIGVSMGISLFQVLLNSVII